MQASCSCNSFVGALKKVALVAATRPLYTIRHLVQENEGLGCSDKALGFCSKALYPAMRPLAQAVRASYQAMRASQRLHNMCRPLQPMPCTVPPHSAIGLSNEGLAASTKDVLPLEADALHSTAAQACLLHP